jgi:hypothetical protein
MLGVGVAGSSKMATGRKPGPAVLEAVGGPASSLARTASELSADLRKARTALAKRRKPPLACYPATGRAGAQPGRGRTGGQMRPLSQIIRAPAGPVCTLSRHRHRRGVDRSASRAAESAALSRRAAAAAA